MAPPAREELPRGAGGPCQARGAPASLPEPLPASQCPCQAHSAGARFAVLVPTLQRWCQAHGTCARLAAPMPSCSAGARLTAPTPCPQEQDQAGTIHVALISPVSHSQHRCHTDNTCTGSQHPHRSSNAWISLTAPIPGSLRTFSRCGPPMPCSQHLCQPHSPFGRLTPPTPSSRHPSHTHSTHPTLQHPSHTHGTNARLSEPIPGLHHLCQAHSTHVLLTAPLAGSQYSHHALYCPRQSHNTHPKPTALIPHSQSPRQAHRISARCVPPV